MDGKGTSNAQGRSESTASEFWPFWHKKVREAAWGDQEDVTASEVVYEAKSPANPMLSSVNRAVKRLFSNRYYYATGSQKSDVHIIAVLIPIHYMFQVGVLNLINI